MGHKVNIETESQNTPQVVDNQHDRNAHMFANSAYRSTKQRGFVTGSDVLKTIESDKAFIEELNIPSFAQLVKLGKL